MAFDSLASTLVDGDTYIFRDVFVHDRQTGETSRVSVATEGTQANAPSYNPSISADGRYVAFYSLANNLVDGDTNGATDIFVRDRQTGQTSRVSVASDSTPGNNLSFNPSISGNGRHVAFTSSANNLVLGDNNGYQDVFVHNRQLGLTRLVSVSSGGAAQGNNVSYYPSISANGQYVAFDSDASNLVTGDTNGVRDIFFHDQGNTMTYRVSVSTGGTQANGASYNPSISADGRYVAFESDATNLVDGDTMGYTDIFVHDLQTGQTSRVSVSTAGVQGNNASNHPSISSNGRYVAFETVANNLVDGDTNGFQDILIHDRQTGQTSRVSISTGGALGNNHSYSPSISADGRCVAFESLAGNLVSGDTNGFQDIFVHDRY